MLCNPTMAYLSFGDSSSPFPFRTRERRRGSTIGLLTSLITILSPCILPPPFPPPAFDLRIPVHHTVTPLHTRTPPPSPNVRQSPPQLPLRPHQNLNPLLSAGTLGQRAHLPTSLRTGPTAPSLRRRASKRTIPLGNHGAGGPMVLLATVLHGSGLGAAGGARSSSGRGECACCPPG